MVITETGWPSGDPDELNPGWETSPEAQAAFVDHLPRLIAGRRLGMIIWAWLYPVVAGGLDPLDWAVFSTIALKDSAGQALPAASCCATAWRPPHP